MAYTLDFRFTQTKLLGNIETILAFYRERMISWKNYVPGWNKEILEFVTKDVDNRKRF